MDVSILYEKFIPDYSLGLLYWKTGRMTGRLDGTKRNHNGRFYIDVQINGRQLRRGRILFAMKNGRWPKKLIDHASGDSTDDSEFNIREATCLQNNWNRRWRKKTTNLPRGVFNVYGKYQARVGYMNKQISFGCYETPEEASNVYEFHRKRLHGEFAPT